jgi:hypothetical protein
MAAIRAKLAANKAKSQNRTAKTAGGEGSSFPFWNISDNSNALIRLLPDGDTSNDYFWVKKETIKLPFAGFTGENATTEDAHVSVTCPHTFGLKCPITDHIRPWWKGTDEEQALARVYYKKPSFIFHGFVVNSDLEEEGSDRHHLRRFNLNRTLFEAIETFIMDPEMEDMPTDLVNGRDFKIAKTKKGGFANYATSAFSMRERSLTDAEMEVVNRGLPSLSDALGRKPDQDELDMIAAMLLDSLAGKPFDTVAYGGLYRAYTKAGQASSLKAPEVEAPANDDAKAKARELLEGIRNRSQNG